MILTSGCSEVTRTRKTRSRLIRMVSENIIVKTWFERKYTGDQISK